MPSAVVNVGTLDGENGFAMIGPAENNARLGTDVASAGDINGDGIDDFIVSATGTHNGSNFGTTYVVFGQRGVAPSLLHLDALNGTNGFIIEGLHANDFSGFQVSGIGDINGDGFDDMVLGAPYADDNGGYSGSAYVIFGHAGPFSANFDLASLNGGNGFRLTGATGDDNGGFAVSAAGDVNGDGVADFVVASPRNDTTGYNAGAAYVVFGQSGGGFSASAGLDAVGGSVAGFQIHGVGAGNAIGSSLSYGDVNNDGFSDVIIGARLTGGQAGAAYVVFGHGGTATDVDLSSLDGTTGFAVTGFSPGDQGGISVASGGDINGDGFDDVIVGARYSGVGGYNAGAVYVVFGKAGGFGASIDINALDGTNGFRLTGAAVWDAAGTSVSSLGDVNGDGYDDLIVGARNGRDAYGQLSGAAYVVYGHGGGFSASLSLGALSVSNGYKISGGAYSSLGISVSSAGDANGDGRPDILVGAYTLTQTNGAQGGAYILYAPSPPIAFNGGAGAETSYGAAASDNLSGGGGADILYGYGANDTLNGDDGGDTLDGGAGADAMTGGTGDDTYYVDDAGDTTTESGGEGNDVVRATISWVLGANIETLILEGSGDMDGTGNALANVITGNSGFNQIDGGDGDDLIKAGGGIDMVSGGLGADQLLGQDGNDSLDGGVGADRLDGGNGDDVLAGGSDNDILDGGAGVDSLDGGIGNDQLNGGTENDALTGGDGNDVLTGGLGADAMTGGLGDDTYYVDDAGDTTTEASGQGADTVHAGLTWTLAANIETLIQDGSANIDGTGNGSANTLMGNGGANTLDGGAGDDVIKAGLGNDILIGGTGADILVGGGGLDIFVVTQASIHTSGPIEVDTVNDLIAGQGDKLDLSAIDADSLTAGDQAFHLVGGFTHHAGELTLTVAGGTTTLQLDVDGDGRADYRMMISGNVTGDSGGWLL
ncbi:Ca2+-binding RTX toxin-like protein [Caulobacter ginsengisoli]|uniref:Ca2+-binding RTX toxin-like protein n=1 Tax=Caulobacter ginsengisoli TaxID=400775 RepID=A0ABU0IN14_9CAUL|nr:FG-GAP-like repeat-containing protein [Caulobacter ginsengisoli]MDQ0463385.1 Ca2+-binding RTX toxin-like protein [Caulobacter ginsengisoli]